MCAFDQSGSFVTDWLVFTYLQMGKIIGMIISKTHDIRICRLLIKRRMIYR
jgi:hypothetical protein